MARLVVLPHLLLFAAEIHAMKAVKTHDGPVGGQARSMLADLVSVCDRRAISALAHLERGRGRENVDVVGCCRVIHSLLSWPVRLQLLPRYVWNLYEEIALRMKMR